MKDGGLSLLLDIVRDFPGLWQKISLLIRSVEIPMVDRASIPAIWNWAVAVPPP
jgi:hypothetical protein